MPLRVLDPGLYTLIVDYGRPHCRSLGVPVGGAADWAALAWGNALVGNAPNTPALEITLAGPTVRAECELACVVFGASLELTGNRQRLQSGRTFVLEEGEVLHVGGVRRGARAYLCVAGGFDGPEVLGSRSGLAPVTADTLLACSPSRIHGRFLTLPAEEPFLLRVLPGPQADWFDGDALSQHPYLVTPAANRMGLRLDGEPLDRHRREELLSEPVCPGTVQIMHDGRPTILGVDAQTIGGYPKIAQVIAADLDKLGQLRPGDTVRFSHVSLVEATRLYRQKEAALANWVLRLRASLPL